MAQLHSVKSKRFSEGKATKVGSVGGGGGGGGGRVRSVRGGEGVGRDESVWGEGREGTG